MYIIKADEVWKRNFDIVIMTCVLYSCIFNLFTICFNVEASEAINIFNWMIEGLFYFDFIFCFNTAYVDKDYKIIDNRWTITRNYLKTWFIIDFMSIFPFGPIITSGSE